MRSRLFVPQLFQEDGFGLVDFGNVFPKLFGSRGIHYPYIDDSAPEASVRGPNPEPQAPA
jgi:hypothetical protein